MPRKLPQWCKRAKKELIDLDMNIEDLAQKTGMTRQYITAIVNGRKYSESAVKAISDVLNITDDYS